MAKYRCPVCGATHKEPPVTCRLCGMRMTENMDALHVSATGTRPVIRTKSGFGTPMLFAVVGVLVLAVAAVGLGFIATDDSETIAEIRRQVPVINDETPDGWTTVRNEADGFAVQMPRSYEDATRPVASAEGGVVSGTGSTAGETALFVGSGEVPESDEDVDARLEVFATELLGVPPDSWNDDEKTSVAGLRALRVQEEKQVEPGVYRTFNTLLFLNGTRLYVIESASKEDPAATSADPPEAFDRVAGTFTIVEPSAA